MKRTAGIKNYFLFIQSGREPWLEEAVRLYGEKISRIVPLEVRALKSKALARDQARLKVQREGELILAQLKPEDHLVIFDEQGLSFKSSEHLAQQLIQVWESGKGRVVFVVGGAFGLSSEVKARAQMSLSLSPLTLNHHMAFLVALEQIYRTTTIWKGIPYHNA